MKLADELLITGIVLIKGILVPLFKLTWRLICWIKNQITGNVRGQVDPESR